MATTTWTPADLLERGRRTGTFINFQEAAAASVGVGDRGIVGIISEDDWGTPNDVVTFNNLLEVDRLQFPFPTGATSSRRSTNVRATGIASKTGLYNLCRLAFLGGASQVKTYRMMGANAVAATETIEDSTSTGVLTLTARYAGLFGNNLRAEVEALSSGYDRLQISIVGNTASVVEVTSTVLRGRWRPDEDAASSLVVSKSAATVTVTSSQGSRFAANDIVGFVSPADDDDGVEQNDHIRSVVSVAGDILTLNSAVHASVVANWHIYKLGTTAANGVTATTPVSSIRDAINAIPDADRWVDASNPTGQDYNAQSTSGGTNRLKTGTTSFMNGTPGDPLTTDNFRAGLSDMALENISVLTTDSTTVDEIISSWIREQRDESKYVMGVVGSPTRGTTAIDRTYINRLTGYVSAINNIVTPVNNEGMVYVAPGLQMLRADHRAQTVWYNGATVASMVAGLIAELPPGESVTKAVLPFSLNVESNFSSNQVESLLAGGVCVLVHGPGTTVPVARVERGITTTAATSGIDAEFRSIRTVRILDAIAEGLRNALSLRHIGQSVNDAVGRQGVIDEVTTFLTSQAESRHIDPEFTVELDSSRSNTGENLFLNIGIRPLDSIEFIYATISVS